MNIINTSKSRWFAALMLVVMSSMSAFAADSITLGDGNDIVLNNHDEFVVPVMLESDGTAAGFSADLVIPDELEYVGSEFATDRKDGHIYNAKIVSPNGYPVLRMLIVSMNRKAFKGTTGPLVNVTLRLKDDVDLASMTEPKTLTLHMQNIVLSNANGSEKLIDGGTADANVVLSPDAPEMVFSTNEPRFIMNPQSEHAITFALSNEVELAALGVDITIPAGFTIKGDSDVLLADRVSQTAGVTVTNRGNGVYNVLFYDFFTNHAINGSSGDLFTIEVVAPADFVEETVSVVLDGIDATPVTSSTQAVSYGGTGCSVTIVNGAVSYAAANAAIAGLNEALESALATIAEEAADVKDQFPGTEISESIAALTAAVEEAYTNSTLADTYDEVMAPAAGISEAIAKLVEDAKAAQAAYEKQVAEDGAKANADTAIAGLNEALESALATIAEEAADVKDQFPGTEISESIAALTAAVEEAYTNSTLADTYDEVMAPAAGISEAIAKLVEDAKAAQTAYEVEQARIAANEAAYQADLDAIAAVEQKLEEALNKIAEEYPTYDPTEAAQAIRDAIAAARQAADDNLAAVAEEGNYTSTLDTSAIETMIEDMLTAAWESGVDGILIDDADASNAIYNLNGVRLSNPVRGQFNIIVKGGKATKVYVK